MSWQVLIMYAVAVVFGLVGTACLVRLASPRATPGQVYAFRMIGIMLVSGAIVLAFSAGAMDRWSAP